MPKIREYESQLSSQYEPSTRRVTAEDTSTGAGTTALGKGVGDVAEVLQLNAERADVTNVHVKLAQARAEWTLHLQQKVRETPAGTAFVPEFIQNLDDYISRTGENIATTPKGRALFTTAAADFRNGMLEKAGLYQAQQAGEKAKADHKTVLDANRNVLLNDPTQFESILRATEAMIGDPNGMYAALPSGAREELRVQARQQLALSTAQGVIQMNPALAKNKLQSGWMKEYLDADNTHSLLREAETGIRGREVESDRLEKKVEKAKKAEHDAIRNDFLRKAESGELTVKELLDSDLPPVGLGSKQQFLELLHRGTRADVAGKTDPRLFNRLMERVNLPEGDPSKLTDEKAVFDYMLRGLDGNGMMQIQQAIKDARSPGGKLAAEAQGKILKEVKPKIVAWQLFGTDEAGERQLKAYSEYVTSEMQRAKDNKENVLDLFDPRSKKYVGAPEVVSRFSRTPQQRIQEQADAVRAASPSKPLPPERMRKQGESIEDYLKRTGIK